MALEWVRTRAITCHGPELASTLSATCTLRPAQGPQLLRPMSDTQRQSELGHRDVVQIKSNLCRSTSHWEMLSSRSHSLTERPHAGYCSVWEVPAPVSLGLEGKGTKGQLIASHTTFLGSLPGVFVGIHERNRIWANMYVHTNICM